MRWRVWGGRVAWDSKDLVNLFKSEGGSAWNVVLIVVLRQARRCVLEKQRAA